MTADFYSNYVNRVPSPFGIRLLKWWHKELLTLSKLQSEISTLSVLEIGPGHGYFAGLVVDSGGSYRFIDIAPGVVQHMEYQGFERYQSGLQKFDVVWVSHVLEHLTDHVAARRFLQEVSVDLKPGGKLVVISPDFLSWKKHFFDVDATHGYPTTIRTVTQLLLDIGMEIEHACHHRAGKRSMVWRCFAALTCLIPTNTLDWLLSPNRRLLRDGPYASWKAVFGWRQILVVARLPAK